MKKFIRMLSVHSIILCLLSINSASQADLIYNSFDGLNQVTNSFTTTGSTPRNFMADGLSTIATPDPSQTWFVEQLGIRIFVTGSGQAGVPQVYENTTMRVRVYDTWSGATTGAAEVFSGMLSDVTWDLGNLTNNSATGGNQFFTYNLDYLGDGFGFNLGSGQNIGISVELLSNGTANQGLALLLRSIAGDPGMPAIGTSSNGWYRDADANGIITGSDFRTLAGTNSNVHFQINASAIPEPGTLTILAMGSIIGLARRRR